MFCLFFLTCPIWFVLIVFIYVLKQHDYLSDAKKNLLPSFSATSNAQISSMWPTVLKLFKLFLSLLIMVLLSLSLVVQKVAFLDILFLISVHNFTLVRNETRFVEEKLISGGNLTWPGLFYTINMLVGALHIPHIQARSPSPVCLSSISGFTFIPFSHLDSQTVCPSICITMPK